MPTGWRRKGAAPQPPPAVEATWETLRRLIISADVPSIERLLARSPSALQPTDSDESPLVFAAFLGRHAVVRLLLERGADPNAAGVRGGSTALVAAVKQGHEATAATLLAATADPSADSPLALAAAQGDEGMVRRLIEAGAAVGAVDGAGETPLHVACVRGHCGTAELLMGASASVDARSSTGSTPLHQAAHYGQAGAVALLLRAGAAAYAVDATGRRPLDVAIADAQGGCAKLLLDRAADDGALEPSALAAAWDLVLRAGTARNRLVLNRGSLDLARALVRRFGRAMPPRTLREMLEACGVCEKPSPWFNETLRATLEALVAEHCGPRPGDATAKMVHWGPEVARYFAAAAQGSAERGALRIYFVPDGERSPLRLHADPAAAADSAGGAVAAVFTHITPGELELPTLDREPAAVLRLFTVEGRMASCATALVLLPAVVGAGPRAPEAEARPPGADATAGTPPCRCRALEARVEGLAATVEALTATVAELSARLAVVADAELEC